MIEPSPIRVLVVDDSVVVRQLVSDALKADGGIEVVGTAQNGRIALEKCEQLKPDLITLDLEMPEVDGLAVLDALRKRPTRLPVIVFSTLTERGASATLDALARGASDYLCKPSKQQNIAATLETIRRELIPRIYGLVRRGSPRAVAVAAAAQAVAMPQPAAAAPVDVIAIGISTGGPHALSTLIPALPKTLGRPVLIVQHMPRLFTKFLAERLSTLSPLPVREARHDENLGEGIYIAPGDQHLSVARARTGLRLVLDQNPPENGCRPSVDVLFRSLAQSFGANVLGIVMTGIGSDGTLGAGALRRVGAQVWAQDAGSSAAWGMPGCVVKAGHAQREVSLVDIAPAIAAAVRLGIGSNPGQRAR